MTKLIIKIKTDLEKAKEILNNKFYFFYYEQRVKSLMKLICSKMKEYEVESLDKNTRLFIEEGTNEEMLISKKRLEDFLYSDSNKLKDNKEITDMKNNRIILIITKKLRCAKGWIKEKAINTALGSSTVFNFLISIGIGITWEFVE